ncbi:ArsR family transcriptional regulator [Nonomuraea mesophila]|uniref:ArsR family transcriptional regulator n=1 Tax=Nonomuraea mesophila TaxID=2530382 RepID=A0A4R5F4J5_9ACTN|nr:helix-turn-helix domain-containing protein [Nonomuraea mesophila]TDE42404.1 ArsR family transcriptional regulator [Nonomuraea mesophila]
MPADKNHRVKDIDTLKALGHPLRIKLYRALFMAGTATASQLADKVDEAVSLVSYHLRKLSAHGVIEEAEPGSGDGRERWWRPVSTTLSTRDEDWRDAPERAAVHTAVSRVYARQWSEMYQEYLDLKETWSDEWRGASFSSEFLFTLTAGELQEFGRDLDELAAKWRERGTTAREAGETQGRENVVLHVNGFPFRT